MKSKLLFLMIVAFMANDLYAILGKSTRYVVVSHKAQSYHDMFGEQKATIIPFAMPLVSTDVKGAKIQFRYQNQDLWIDESDLIALDFSVFSENTTPFFSVPIVNDKDFWFIYKNAMYKMDLSDYTNPEIQLISKIPFFIDAIPSNDRKMWFFVGENTINDKPIMNLSIFDVKEEKFYPLTSLYDDGAKIDSVEFSPNNKQVAVLFNLKNINYVYIFNVQDQSLVYSQSKVSGFTWYNEELVIYSEKKTELFVEDSVKEIIATHQRSPIPKMLGDRLIISIDGEIYSYQHGELTKTDYRSLDRSIEGSFEQYEDSRGTIFTRYNGTIIRLLTGTTPRWTLLSYLDEKRLFYTERQGPFQTLYIYDADQDKSTSYKWIENILGSLSNGVLVDVSIDGKEVWLFIESPYGEAKALQLHNIL